MDNGLAPGQVVRYRKRGRVQEGTVARLEKAVHPGDRWGTPVSHLAEVDRWVAIVVFPDGSCCIGSDLVDEGGS